jgi:hypothetical protein
MTTGAFVAKRFLLGINGDMVNADYIVRIYFDATGRIFADMPTGPAIELKLIDPIPDPTRDRLTSLPVTFVSVG